MALKLTKIMYSDNNIVFLYSQNEKLSKYIDIVSCVKITNIVLGENSITLKGLFDEKSLFYKIDKEMIFHIAGLCSRVFGAESALKVTDFYKSEVYK